MAVFTRLFEHEISTWQYKYKKTRSWAHDPSLSLSVPTCSALPPACARRPATTYGTPDTGETYYVRGEPCRAQPAAGRSGGIRLRTYPARRRPAGPAGRAASLILRAGRWAVAVTRLGPPPPGLLAWQLRLRVVQTPKQATARRTM